MSTYIDLVNYQRVITERHLMQLIEQDTALLDETEAVGIREMSAYLCQRFDTDALFEDGKATDYPEVVMYLTDIVLYHLHTRLAPGKVPEVRAQRYLDAQKWLTDVREGKLCADLPLPIDPETGEADQADDGPFIIDSIYERKNYRY